MSIFARRKPDHAEQDRREALARLATEIDTVRAVLARYPRGTTLHFGAPTKCPGCGDYGFVGAVHHALGTAHLDCFGCHADWVISRDALEAVAAEPTPATVRSMPLTPEPLIAAPLPDEVVPAPAAPIVRLDRPSTIIDARSGEAVPDHPSIRPVPSPVTPRLISVPTGPTAGPATTATTSPSVDPACGSEPEGEPVHVLVVDDNPFDVAIVDELLGDLPGGTVERRHAPTLADGVREALTGRVDIVLLDLGLPDSSGIATLLEWQLAAATSAPVIVVTGDDHPDTVREAQLLGAAQFVHKQHLADLVGRADGSTKLLRLLRNTASTRQRQPSA